jgi:hypothetical protein
MFYRLIRVFVAAALLLALGESLAGSPATKTAREWGFETDTFATTLPSSVPTSMTARHCIQCGGVELQVTKDTKFFLGTTAVSLKELRLAAQSKHFMMVFYKPATSIVSRIVIDGVSSVAQK